MIRKHFETSSKSHIREGSLIKFGLRYYVRYMDKNDLPQNLALQDHVIDALKAIGKTHYIIPKNEAYLRKLLDRGNAIVGTFVRGQLAGEADRLAAHMLIVYPQTQQETGLSDPGMLPEKNLAKVTIVSNILVHQDFRGNRLMQQMLDEWLKIAASDGKHHAVAEVCLDNDFSWSVFLDCGFVIYADGHDDRDGSELVYLHKPLDREFLYSADPREVTVLKLFDQNDQIDPQARSRLKDLLAQGYHALDYDRNTKGLLLAKCVGTAPLPSAGKTPPGPANDIGGPK